MTFVLFAFGLCIFLFAMRGLESGIRLLGGDGLKHWIVARTSNPISSAGCGVAVTAILQSSSMVSLVVLAFVSAGIMPLYNGIGVVLGANLGTTFTGWMVTVIGFKMNLQSMVVPLMGLGAACNIGFKTNRRLAGIGEAIFAFGLLIFGLGIMKDSVVGFSEVFDLNSLQDVPAWVYLLSGIILAAVMQSSSAVMIIALSMLNSDMFHLTDAAAVVIGADLGTTSTTVLGSLGESMVKKQLAFAHVCFNVLVNSLAFLFLLPALPWFLSALSIQDKMFGLVAFHSAFNLSGLIIFLPLLKHYTRWIQRLLPLQEGPKKENFDVPVEVADAAVDSLTKAHRHLTRDAVRLSWQGLNFNPDQIGISESLLMSDANANDETHMDNASFANRYESLKAFEGDLIRYADQLRHTQLSPAQDQQIGQLIESARSLVYASKTLKDVRADVEQLHHAINDALAVELNDSHLRFLRDFFKDLIPLFSSEHSDDYVSEQIEALRELNSKHHQHANELILQHIAAGDKTTGRLSTWFNLNHELHHYVRYMLSALARPS